MKTIFTAIFATLIIFSKTEYGVSQEGPVLNLITTLSLQGITSLYFEGPTHVEIQLWENSYLKVEIIVEEPVFTKTQLKSLIPLGFFKVDQLKNGDELYLFMPGQAKKLTINGQEVNGFVKLKVTVPNHIKIGPHANKLE